MAALTAPLAARFYRSAGRLVTPLAPGLLAWRAGHGKEDPRRRGERLGRPSRPRPAGPLVWIHAASIGEAVSALPLCAGIIEEGCRVLFTTGTVTSAQVLSRRLPEGAVHQFVPLDLPRAIATFVDHWQPDVAIFIESEVWPTTLGELRHRGIPTALVNARLSARSVARWARMSGLARWLFGGFDVLAAQSQMDADRLAVLTGGPVTVTGNIKFDAPVPPANTGDLAKARGAVGKRPVIAAASIHPGETASVLDAHRSVRVEFGDLLTLVAPRHPERGDEIAAAARRRGLAVVRRSDDALPDAQTDIWLFDTVGELGLVYALAPVAFCGGSLIRHGGQNPIEPARAGAAILHGPHVHNFTVVYDALDDAGGAMRLSGPGDLEGGLRSLLREPERRGAMAAAASSALDDLSGATARTLDLVRPLLCRSAG